MKKLGWIAVTCMVGTLIASPLIADAASKPKVRLDVEVLAPEPGTSESVVGTRVNVSVPSLINPSSGLTGSWGVRADCDEGVELHAPIGGPDLCRVSGKPGASYELVIPLGSVAARNGNYGDYWLLNTGRKKAAVTFTLELRGEHWEVLASTKEVVKVKPSSSGNGAAKPDLQRPKVRVDVSVSADTAQLSPEAKRAVVRLDGWKDARNDSVKSWELRIPCPGDVELVGDGSEGTGNVCTNGGYGVDQYLRGPISPEELSRDGGIIDTVSMLNDVAKKQILSFVVWGRGADGNPVFEATEKVVLKAAKKSSRAAGATKSAKRDVIQITSPTRGSVFDNGPAQPIIVGWHEYAGDFDYYRVYVGNGPWRDGGFPEQIDKRSNGYLLAAGQIVAYLEGVPTHEDGAYYVGVMAMKRAGDQEVVVAEGQSPSFTIER